MQRWRPLGEREGGKGGMEQSPSKGSHQTKDRQKQLRATRKAETTYNPTASRKFKAENGPATGRLFSEGGGGTGDAKKEG